MEEEFIKAYDAHADAIFRHCYLRISDRETALDLTQETFRRTWDYIAEGKEIRNMRAFLYRVAHNLLVDEYRKRKHLSLEQLAEDGFQLGAFEEVDFGKNIDYQYVIKNIEGLDSIYREALLLRYVEELSIKEIADIIKETENVVSVRINRGLAKLRSYEHD